MIKCTIAIPVYNRVDLNRRAIDSALAQNVPDLEILVVDDCSTDNSWDILQAYSDPRLRLVRNESNAGLIGNFNRCLDLAQGKYFRLLCTDDKLPPFCLNQEINIMEANQNVVLLSTRGRLVDNNGQFTAMFADHFPSGIYAGEHALFSWLWFQSHYGFNPFNYPSGNLLRRQIAQQSGGFDLTMKVGGDIDLYLHMLEKGDLAVLDTVGCEITVHADQESNHLRENGGFIQDLFALNHRYQLLLEKRNSYSRVMQQTAAIAAGTAIKFLLAGHREAGRLHWELAHNSGFGDIKALLALIRLAGLRALLKITGVRITQLPPPLPFNIDRML